MSIPFRNCSTSNSELSQSMPIRTAAARASSGKKPERLTPSTQIRNRQMRRPLIARTRPARPRFGCPSSLTTDCRQTTGHAAHAQRPDKTRPRTTRADELHVGASRYPKAAAEPARLTQSVARRRCAIRAPARAPRGELRCRPRRWRRVHQAPHKLVDEVGGVQIRQAGTWPRTDRHARCSVRTDHRQDASSPEASDRRHGRRTGPPQPTGNTQSRPGRNDRRAFSITEDQNSAKWHPRPSAHRTSSAA